MTECGRKEEKEGWRWKRVGGGRGLEKEKGKKRKKIGKGRTGG